MGETMEQTRHEAAARQMAKELLAVTLYEQVGFSARRSRTAEEVRRRLEHRQWEVERRWQEHVHERGWELFREAMAAVEGVVGQVE